MKTLKELIEIFRGNGNIAIVNRTEYRRFSYSYNKLYELAGKAATFFQSNGIRKGDRIIIWGPNGIEWATVFLGAILSGVVVVPIDLRSDAEFARKIQNQVNAKVIFQTKYKPKLEKRKVVYVEDLMDMLDNIEIKYSSPEINENDVIELVYTSGTTGEVKGVILSHKNIAANVSSLCEFERISSNSKFLSLLPLSHMFEQTVGFFTPLLSQASIVYIKSLKASIIFDALREEKVTNIVIVPRLLELIRSGILSKVRERVKEEKFNRLIKRAEKLALGLRKLLFRNVHRAFGGNLRYFICGGAPLDEDLEHFYDNLGLLIVQGYGLTETSPVLTANKPSEKKIGSVGKVIPRIELKIAADNEILARGASITAGYYKNKKLTQELFEDGWFKTGDVGYFEGGWLYIKGRKKDMIKTSAGINIYPEDIETVLNKIKGVRDSCVVNIKEKKSEAVHAVLLLEKGIDAKAVIDESNSKLGPSQKITNFSVWPYEDFPRTTTLKVRKFLVRDTIGKKVKEIPKIITRENKIYNALAQLTEKKITAETNLESLGLSSIDIVELVSLLEQEFSIEIDEEKILPSTKVEELENIVGAQRAIAAKPIYKGWTLIWPVRVLRFIGQAFILHPIVRLFSWPRIYGKENLAGLKGPVVFAANHQSHFDTPILLMKLPLRFSVRAAVPTLQEFFFTPEIEFKSFGRKTLFYLLTIFFNIYPFPQEKGFKKSLKYTGKLIDRGWNVLIFPEGERTVTGKVLPFKQGIGVLAVEMKVPVVPLKIENSLNVLQRGKKWPSFGIVKIKVGKPIIKQGSYIEATSYIEKAVRGL